METVLIDLFFSPIHVTEEAQTQAVIRKNTSKTGNRVLDNLGLVYDQSKKYAAKFSNGNFEVADMIEEDLVQEGIVGLIQADEKYDWRRGTKFCTFATPWIKKYIFMYLNGMYSRPLVGLDTGDDAADEDDGEVSAPVDNYTDGSSVYKDMDEAEMRDMVKKVISVLSDKERFIIEKHYGMGDCRPMTLKEIGDILGVTGQRVFSIEKNALKKMRRAIPEEEALLFLQDLN